MLASDLAISLDPVLLAEQAGIDLDPWQVEVLRSPASRKLLNCSRQSGKTTITAVSAVHTAVYQPGSLVLFLSPSLRQSQESFRACLNVYAAIAGDVPASAESALRLELRNGSRIVSLPGKEGTVRGYAGVDLLAIDEASRVPDALYYSVRPMLAVSGGRLIAPSTPFGTRGWWYQEWEQGENWNRWKVPASECPRISAEFLAEEQRAMGEWWFSQEYGCEFLDAETAAFRSIDIESAFTGEVETWNLAL